MWFISTSKWCTIYMGRHRFQQYCHLKHHNVKVLNTWNKIKNKNSKSTNIKSSEQINQSLLELESITAITRLILQNYRSC